jgi:phage portal protein BeeE
VLQAISAGRRGTGSLPLRVYKGKAPRSGPPGTWRWRLLHDKPNDEQSAFDFWHDVAACVETHGNAYLLKDLSGLGTCG